MKKIIIIVILVGLAVFVYFNLNGGKTTSSPEPTYTSDVFTFYCPSDLTFTIQYDDAADNAVLSLSGIQHKLVRSRSASGARYASSNGEVEFWEHQDEASLQLPGLTEPMVCLSTPLEKTEVAHSDLISIETPSVGQKVGNPVTLKGEARGYWFFEASAPVVVTNWDGLIIGEGYVTADGEWMTEDFVPFSGTIEYTLPAGSYSNEGTVIFKRDNPSGLPENDASVEVSVILEFSQ